MPILQPNINFNLFILLLSIPCKAILYKYSTTYMHFVDFLLIFNNWKAFFWDTCTFKSFKSFTSRSSQPVRKVWGGWEDSIPPTKLLGWKSGSPRVKQLSVYYTLKGAVSRDFLLFFYFMKRSHLEPW